MLLGFVILSHPKILPLQYWEVVDSIWRWWNSTKCMLQKDLIFERCKRSCEYIYNFCAIVYYWWEGGWGGFSFNKILLFRIVCTKVHLIFLKIVRYCPWGLLDNFWDYGYFCLKVVLELEACPAFLGLLCTKVFLLGVILNVSRMWPGFLFFCHWGLLVSCGFSYS